MRFYDGVAYATLTFEVVVIASFIFSYLQFRVLFSFMIVGAIQLGNTLFWLIECTMRQLNGKGDNAFSLNAVILSFCVTVILMVAAKFVF